MPELPEVQTFVNTIHKNYVGKTIESIVFHRNNLRYPLDKKKLTTIFSRNLILLKCFRVGKQLVLQTEAGAVIIGLGMTGSFKVTKLNSPEKHEHISLLFQDNINLGFIDPRRFSSWLIYDENKDNQFVDALNSNDLYELFKSKKFSQSQRKVKDFLMDQKMIGGIGNIYALEALFRCKIHPFKPCCELDKSEKQNLCFIIPNILKQAIDCEGSSVLSYKTLNGKTGSFQQHHLVYQRDGEECLTPNCRSTILRIESGGRGNWFCPKCQKL